MKPRTTRVARRWTARATLTTLLLLAIAGPAAAQEGFPGEKTRDRWRNDVVLYLWAVNIDADMTLGSTRAPVDVTFGDLFGKLKFAASIHYEGHKRNWGLMLDGSYVNLGEDGITVFQGPDELTVTADYRLKLYAGEAALTWFPVDLGSQRLNFLGGVRYNALDADLALTATGIPGSREGGFDESWVDPIVGVRWGIGWGKYDRWFFMLRSDIGGFGVGSDLAWNLVADFGFRISRVVTVGLGGRYLYTDYSSGTIDTDGYFAFKGNEFGLLAGLGVRF